MTSFKVKPIYYAVVGVVLAFWLAIAVAAAGLVWEQRQNALKNSAAQANRFVGGAVAALNRTLLGVDVLLASMDEALELDQRHLDTLDRTAAKHTMHTIVGRNLMLRQLALLDAQSNVLASSDLDGVASLSLPAHRFPAW
jgi:uncharacterized protein HemX